jgi:predicted MFS family arabinose efflux permease
VTPVSRAPDAPAPAGTSRFVATAAILVALVVSAFEGTVVTGAMPVIVAELGGLGIYSWVFSAFLLASTIGILACGKLADAYGRRPVFIAGMGLFLFGSALSGAARSIEALIAFRVIQGLGAGAIHPIAMTISADLYTLRERARVQGAFTAAWGAANVLGPLLGGLIVRYLGWRWVFLVNVPVGLVAVVLLLASYRDPARPHRGPGGALAAVVAGVVASLVLFALEPGGVPPGGRVALVAAAAALAAALDRQQRRAVDPLLPPALLPDPVVRAGVVGGLFAGGLLFACSAYVPLWLSRTMHSDALTAGASLVPLLGGWALGSTFGVHVLVRRGMRASVAGGFAVALVGAAALAFAAHRELPVGLVFAALGLLGLGLGPAASTSLIAPQSHVPWQSRGMITSVIYAARMLGGSIAVAALGALGGGEDARFVGIAVIALGAFLLLAVMAPARPAPGVGAALPVD